MTNSDAAAHNAAGPTLRPRYTHQHPTTHTAVRINKLRIRNFRSIKELEIDLGPTTVLIGPNNSGKTAILDALRIPLLRRWGRRGTGFSEHDVHLASDTDDPKDSPGVTIEIQTEEKAPGEWPDQVVQALDQIAQLDPISGLNSIALRVSWSWNPAEKAFESSWMFLNAARQPLVGGAARRLNLERFWQYIPVFYLGPLRDVGEEFSSRSRFWRQLLDAMEIPSELDTKVRKILGRLNRRLLDADPRLREIARTLSGATQIAARDRAGDVDLQLVPVKSRDLLNKAEIVMRNEPDWPWLPLQQHGQGLQSLSVMFLFQAFVDHLLSDFYEPESEPILALEEPETHLHPQAARNLWNHVNALPGQKIITTHSPFFVQHVPFREMRIVRLTEEGTKVWSLPSTFSATVPHVTALKEVVDANEQLSYEAASGTITVAGRLDEQTYRRLLTCYGGHPDRRTVESILRDLRDRSQLHMSDNDLQALETFARRIRGEIFFATRWLIVEGQDEYHVVHAMARQLDYDFDQHGVAVIDSQNNGNPAIFAALARPLGIPWLAVFDGDEAGQRYIRAIQARGFDNAYVAERCRRLPNGNLEQQLIADGLENELRAILIHLGHADANLLNNHQLAERLHEAAYARELAATVLANANLAQTMLEPFRDAIFSLRGHV